MLEQKKHCNCTTNNKLMINILKFPETIIQKENDLFVARSSAINHKSPFSFAKKSLNVQRICLDLQTDILNLSLFESLWSFGLNYFSVNY